jgi:hypothetical protein
MHGWTNENILDKEAEEVDNGGYMSLWIEIYYTLSNIKDILHFTLENLITQLQAPYICHSFSIYSRNNGG